MFRAFTFVALLAVFTFSIGCGASGEATTYEAKERGMKPGEVKSMEDVSNQINRSAEYFGKSAEGAGQDASAIDQSAIQGATKKEKEGEKGGE